MLLCPTYLGYLSFSATVCRMLCTTMRRLTFPPRVQGLVGPPKFPKKLYLDRSVEKGAVVLASIHLGGILHCTSSACRESQSTAFAPAWVKYSLAHHSTRATSHLRCVCSRSQFNSQSPRVPLPFFVSLSVIPTAGPEALTSFRITARSSLAPRPRAIPACSVKALFLFFLQVKKDMSGPPGPSGPPRLVGLSGEAGAFSLYLSSSFRLEGRLKAPEHLARAGGVCVETCRRWPPLLLSPSFSTGPGGFFRCPSLILLLACVGYGCMQARTLARGSTPEVRDGLSSRALSAEMVRETPKTPLHPWLTGPAGGPQVIRSPPNSD